MIAEEARGSPFLACALATAAASHLGQEPGGATTFTLPAVLAAQLRALPSSAERLFQAVAMIGQPLPLGVLLEATESSHADVDVLRVARLARTVGHSSTPLIACYHDRDRSPG